MSLEDHLLTHKSVLRIHFSPAVTSLPSCYRRSRGLEPFLQGRTSGGKNECDGATHQHAIIPVLVEQQHPRLGGHGDGLLGGASVMGVEDGLAAVAGEGGVVSLFPMS